MKVAEQNIKEVLPETRIKSFFWGMMPAYYALGYGLISDAVDQEEQARRQNRNNAAAVEELRGNHASAVRVLRARIRELEGQGRAN